MPAFTVAAIVGPTEVASNAPGHGQNAHDHRHIRLLASPTARPPAPRVPSGSLPILDEHGVHGRRHEVGHPWFKKTSARGATGRIDGTAGTALAVNEPTGTRGHGRCDAVEAVGHPRVRHDLQPWQNQRLKRQRDRAGRGAEALQDGGRGSRQDRRHRTACGGHHRAQAGGRDQQGVAGGCGLPGWPAEAADLPAASPCLLGAPTLGTTNGWTAVVIGLAAAVEALQVGGRRPRSAPSAAGPLATGRRRAQAWPVATARASPEAPLGRAHLQLLPRWRPGRSTSGRA